VFPIDAKKIAEFDESTVILVHFTDHFVKFMIGRCEADAFKCDLQILSPDGPDPVLGV
jgi:hypothetical protein